MRAAGPDDAAALLRLKQRLDQETSFMLMEAGERDASVPALARELESAAESGNSVVIMAEMGGELAGYVELTGGTFHRNQGLHAKPGGEQIGVAIGDFAELARLGANGHLRRRRQP